LFALLLIAMPMALCRVGTAQGCKPCSTWHLGFGENAVRVPGLVLNLTPEWEGGFCHVQCTVNLPLHPTLVPGHAIDPRLLCLHYVVQSALGYRAYNFGPKHWLFVA